MLILTRYSGERVNIAGNIWVTVLGHHQGCVTLGINAPDDIAIHREEIYQKMQEQKLRQAQTEVVE